MMDSIKKNIRCPQCRTLTEWQENPFRPFCSERCRLIDLGSWASGDYAIVGASVPQDDENTEI
ncbi:MAG: DNA gyrase inhibitor YacG [Geopsychrobacter sp.]|nr:DNA gyrase inhibitor YacG [Geopsychrobacter sp.]